MEMDDDAWTCVRNTPGVTGFLGGNGKPAPLSRDEYNKMMRKSDRGTASKHTSVDIEVGTTVKVISGPLSDFDGKVSEVNAEAGKVKVTLVIFGRETPVELSFDQITVDLLKVVRSRVRVSPADRSPAGVLLAGSR